MTDLMKFEIDVNGLVSDALQQEGVNQREVVQALTRILRYAIGIATEGHEDGGAEVRDEASDTLYGASTDGSFMLASIEQAFIDAADGDLIVMDYEEYVKIYGEDHRQQGE